MNRETSKTILFDLDATLLDTAPDFVYALNSLLSTRGLPPLPPAAIRTSVSYGSVALIELAFKLTQKDKQFQPLREELLDIYSKNLTRFTRPFIGIEEVLSHISERNMDWAIVTSKPAWLTIPLLEHIKLLPPPAMVVSGDTLAHTKPHPAPLLHVCKKLGVDVRDCIFVGDSEDDVKAGKKAGMLTIIAEYGYSKNSIHAQSWKADAYIKSPIDLLEWIV